MDEMRVGVWGRAYRMSNFSQSRDKSEPLKLLYCSVSEALTLEWKVEQGRVWVGKYLARADAD